MRIHQDPDRAARKGHRGSPTRLGPAASGSGAPASALRKSKPRGFADFPQCGFGFIVESHGSYRHASFVLPTVLHRERRVKRPIRIDPPWRPCRRRLRPICSAVGWPCDIDLAPDTACAGTGSALDTAAEQVATAGTHDPTPAARRRRGKGPYGQLVISVLVRRFSRWSAVRSLSTACRSPCCRNVRNRVRCFR